MAISCVCCALYLKGNSINQQLQCSINICVVYESAGLMDRQSCGGVFQSMCIVTE